MLCGSIQDTSIGGWPLMRDHFGVKKKWAPNLNNCTNKYIRKNGRNKTWKPLRKSVIYSNNKTVWGCPGNVISNANDYNTLKKEKQKTFKIVLNLFKLWINGFENITILSVSKHKNNFIYKLCVWCIRFLWA